jgi:hypothetical protein
MKSDIRAFYDNTPFAEALKKAALDDLRLLMKLTEAKVEPLKQAQELANRRSKHELMIIACLIAKGHNIIKANKIPFLPFDFPAHYGDGVVVGQRIKYDPSNKLRSYEFDLLFIDGAATVFVEINGGTMMRPNTKVGGGHGNARDYEKFNFATTSGLKLLVYTGFLPFMTYGLAEVQTLNNLTNV